MDLIQKKADRQCKLEQPHPKLTSDYCNVNKSKDSILLNFGFKIF